MIEKKLTIAIPTYKRPDFLDKCLSSIFSAIEGEDVDVLVMDDSVDDTNILVCKKYEGIRHIRNEKNLGIDANICACVENAESQYVWLIGEDDLIRKKSFREAYSILGRIGNYPFVFANYSYITSDQKFVLRNVSVDVAYGEMEFKKFFEDYLWSAGFVGGCIVNRSAFLGTDYKNYIGTYYAHVAGICLASLGDKIFVINRPIVGNRVGNAATFTWAEDYFGVFEGWRALLNRMKCYFGEDSYQKAFESHKKAHGYLKYKFLLNKKADGLLNKSDVEKLISFGAGHDEIRRAFFVSKYVPRRLCIMLRGGYGFFKKLKIKKINLDE